MAESFKMKVSDDKVASIFALMLLHEVTNAHLLHWATNSFSEHEALGEFYSSLDDKADAFVEAYMGKYGQLKIENYPEVYSLPKSDCVAHLEELSDNVKNVREKLPQDSELQNLVDEIADLIDSTLYKLRFLK
jgi:DNA-binding ferritin-like protein